MDQSSEAYKREEAQQWDNAAFAWHKWIPTINAFLSVATQDMLDQAKIGEGDKVLDIAAGDGGQSVIAAARVGKSGAVLATDISPEFVKIANRVARDNGLDHLRAEVMDAENLSLESNYFDAAISRLGLMFLPDPLKGLTEIHRVLKLGGHFSAVVFTTPDKTPFFILPPKVIRDRLNLPSPILSESYHPGPFALGTEDHLVGLFRKAGFSDIEEAIIEAPLRFKTTEDFVLWRKEVAGSLQKMLDGQDPNTQKNIWNEVIDVMRQYETKDGFETPCELLICSGQKA